MHRIPHKQRMVNLWWELADTLTVKAWIESCHRPGIEDGSLQDICVREVMHAYCVNFHDNRN